MTTCDHLWPPTNKHCRGWSSLVRHNKHKQRKPIRASVFADRHTGSPQSPQKLLEFWCYAVLCLFPQVHTEWSFWAVNAILCFETSSFRQFLQTMNVWFGCNRDIPFSSPWFHVSNDFMTGWTYFFSRVNQMHCQKNRNKRVKQICAWQWLRAQAAAATSPLGSVIF